MIMDYMEQILGEGTSHPNTSRGQQYSYQCPLCHDHKERLFVHPDRKTYYCHNCESAGSLITFISEYTGISWYDALGIFREYETYEAPLPDDIHEEIYSRLMNVSSEIKTTRYVHPLPEEFILLEEAKGKSGQMAVRYARSRGISLDMASRYYIGYCAEGKYANRIIMPDFEDGELLYWQARTWEPEPENKIKRKLYRKVLNPSSVEELGPGINPVDKSEVLGNIDFIRELGMAVVCEGRADSYAIGDIGAHLHGKHMSDVQYMKLVTNKDKIEVVAVMLDGDAFSSTVSTAERLYKHFDEVLVCKLPEDKDPSSLGRKGVLEHLHNALPYNDLFKVKARLKGWI